MPTTVPVAKFIVVRVSEHEGTAIHVGPGMDYDVIGLIVEGGEVKVNGRNMAGDWLRLSDESEELWIYRPSVTVNIEHLLPVAQNSPTPAPPPAEE